jgi:hypothetical protein
MPNSLTPPHLSALGRANMLLFLVTEADADAIRAIFNREGELSAAIELRRRFPGITTRQGTDIRSDNRRTEAATARELGVARSSVYRMLEAPA